MITLGIVLNGITNGACLHFRVHRSANTQKRGQERRKLRSIHALEDTIDAWNGVDVTDGYIVKALVIDAKMPVSIILLNQGRQRSSGPRCSSMTPAKLKASVFFDDTTLQHFLKVLPHDFFLRRVQRSRCLTDRPVTYHLLRNG